MSIVMIMLIGMLLVLSFLYLSLKHDVKELHKQLAYTNREKSEFEFFTTSSDKNMMDLCRDCNELRAYYVQYGNDYRNMDQNFKKMITNISHDIRTPLTSMSGYLQLLEECQDEEKKLYYTEIVHQRMEYLHSLLEELFLYTKITNNSIELQIEELCPYELTCDVLMHYYQQFTDKGINVVIDFNDERANIMADSMCFERILNNLFQNVWKHGCNTFKIEETSSNEEIRLCFLNDIKEAEMDVSALFQRFYTADKSRNKQNTGLGLAIVKELVDKMGGFVDATLKEDQLCIVLCFKKNR